VPSGQERTCKDTCTVATSICSNADKICTIAKDLGGGDLHPNSKCMNGNPSCDPARKKCCGRQL
jgi:hypothetical protein